MADSQDMSNAPQFQPRSVDASLYAKNLLRHLPNRVAPSGDGCWIWTGAVQGFGYGSVTFNDGVKRRMRPVHRLVYELCVGPITDGKNVLHRCDVPRCCRPDHLFLGTQRENVHDCLSKERHRTRSSPANEANPNAKLTADDVRDIRRKARSGTPLVQLQRDYRLSRAGVSRIVNGKAWAHLDMAGSAVFTDGGGI
jgi:hypothetical protein